MLIGYVGRAPELRYTPSGKAVASFGLRIPRAWTSPDGERRVAEEWVNVVAWRQLAEQCQAEIRPEAQIYVEGQLQTRAWRDAEGAQHERVEVVASEILVLCSGRAEAP